jgi:tRNA 2-thiouridine synthesizing protein A
MEAITAVPQETPAPPAARHEVDLTGELCPMTFVKAKIYLERIAPGELLDIILLPGEQIQNVPRSLKEDGHKIERVEREDGRFRLAVRRAG